MHLTRLLHHYHSVAFILLLLFVNQQPSFAGNTSASALNVHIQQQQLLVDAHIQLGMTDTMEKALQHGIAIEYLIQVDLLDPTTWFWEKRITRKNMRVRLSYDSFKRTYLLSNLTLGRITTDKDLERALQSLGHIQSLPLIDTAQLTVDKSYQLKLSVSLERGVLPNALRLTSFFDPNWRIDLTGQTQNWTYQP